MTPIGNGNPSFCTGPSTQLCPSKAEELADRRRKLIVSSMDNVDAVEPLSQPFACSHASQHTSQLVTYI